MDALPLSFGETHLFCDRTLFFSIFCLDVPATSIPLFPFLLRLFPRIAPPFCHLATKDIAGAAFFPQGRFPLWLRPASFSMTPVKERRLSPLRDALPLCRDTFLLFFDRLPRERAVGF